MARTAVMIVAAAWAIACAACAVNGEVADQPREGEEPTPPTTACSEETQSRVTRLTLFNIELQRRCNAQSGGVTAFPFDAAPSREQLVRLSASPACLVVSKAILRVVQYECDLAGVPLRATAETVLKLREDRKDPALFPVPIEEVLQQLILDRADMNRQRDADPIGFIAEGYSVELKQYDTQLAAAYAEGIVLLSENLQITSDLSGTEGSGSEDAAAAVAQLTQDEVGSGSSSVSQGDESDQQSFGSSIDDALPSSEPSEASASDSSSGMDQLIETGPPSSSYRLQANAAFTVLTMILAVCTAQWFN